MATFKSGYGGLSRLEEIIWFEICTVTRRFTNLEKKNWQNRERAIIRWVIRDNVILFTSKRTATLDRVTHTKKQQANTIRQ